MKIFNSSLMIKVEDTLGKGMGLVAVQDIKKDDLVFVVSGTVVKDMNRYTVPIAKDIVIETKIDDQYCTDAYFINHSCDPTTYLENGVLCKALNDINKGQEISIHYGTLGCFGNEWSREDRICECRSKNCPGTVNGYNEFTEEEKQRLGPIIQDWVKEKYG